jgi:phospholipid transport system substrate-binding protein
MRRLLAVPLLLAVLGAVPASAGEPTERLRSLFVDANRLFLSPAGGASLEDRLAAVRALLEDAFDAREAVAFALGREWEARTPAERDELARLYADLVARAYLAWLGSHARVLGSGVEMTFESESVEGDRAAVGTTLETRAGGDVTIDYRLRRREGRWVVHDVVVDGLSLADSYRAQFQRVLQDGGAYPDLLARLRDKASAATLIAIARSRPPQPVSVAPPPARSLVKAAAASAPAPTPQPVRLASAAPVSDTPPVERRTQAAHRLDAATVETPAAPAAAVIGLPPSAASPAAAEAARPRAPVMRVPVARRSFWIQVGAFRDAELASRLVERLGQYRVTVATRVRPSGALARVLVGPFTDRTAAGAALRELAAAGHRAFVAFE